jgi:hypothetical protein
MANNDNKDMVIFVAALVCIGFVVVLVLNLFIWPGREDALEPFEAYLDEYSNIPVHEPKEVLQRSHLVGKVITINKRTRKIDRSVYHELPEKYRATNPEEVETVVWLTRGKYVAGIYKTSGAKAYVHTLDVTIIDKANGTIIGKKRFSGSGPPRIKAVGISDWHSSKPTAQEVADYIEGLPYHSARFVYAKRGIPIRSGPGKKSVSRQANKGEALEYLSLEGNWYKLKVAEGKPQEWVNKYLVTNIPP